MSGRGVKRRTAKLSFCLSLPCLTPPAPPSSNSTRELFLKKCDLPWLKNLRSKGDNQQPNSNSTYYGGPGSGTRTERYWLKASALTPSSPLLPESEHKNETVLRERETCSSSQRKEVHWSFRRIVCQLWDPWELKLWTCITCHMILVITRKITPSEMFLYTVHCLKGLSLYENVRAKDGGKEKTGETVLRFSFFSFSWSLALCHQSLSFRACLCAKNKASEEEEVALFMWNSASGSLSTLIQSLHLGKPRVSGWWKKTREWEVLRTASWLTSAFSRGPPRCPKKVEIYLCSLIPQRFQGWHSLEKSLNFRGSHWKVLKFLYKSLKSAEIFFDLKINVVALKELFLKCFLVVQDRK